MNEEVQLKVQLMTHDDLRVILFVLMECQSAWRMMLDDGDLPNVPNLDLAKAQYILTRFSEVRLKVEAMLGVKL
jgi:hypothetical protein